MPFRLLLAAPLLVLAAGCDTSGTVVDNDRDRPGLAVAESDASVAASFDRLTAALGAAPPVSVVARVDHQANARRFAGLDLRPTRVVLFGNPRLGTPLMQVNQRAGLDLPQKVLVYEDPQGRTFVSYNTADCLAERHDVGRAASLGQIEAALRTFAQTAAGGEVAFTSRPASVRGGEGVVEEESANDFETTYARLRAAVSGNPNLTVVAELDHQANAASVDLELRPTRLLVFGNPALGTQLMQDEQTIGIDFPQKMLVYEDARGRVFVAYNDPGYLADRHDLDASDDVTDAVETALQALAEAATLDEDDG